MLDQPVLEPSADALRSLSEGMWREPGPVGQPLTARTLADVLRAVVAQDEITVRRAQLGERTLEARVAPLDLGVAARAVTRDQQGASDPTRSRVAPEDSLRDAVYVGRGVASVFGRD